MKNFCKKAFYSPDTKLFNVIGDILSIVIIISVLSIVLESVPSLVAYTPIFHTIEFISVIIFSMEYLGRLVGSEKKKNYIFSFWGLIDLIAVLPTLLQLANLTPLKSARALHILRFLRTLRLVKLAKFQHLNKKTSKDKNVIIRLNISIYLLTLFLTVLILGNLAFIFEEGNPHFSSIPISMFYILQTVIGINLSPGVIPETVVGIGLFIIAKFMGLVLLGLLIHIVATVLTSVLLGSKKET